MIDLGALKNAVKGWVAEMLAERGVARHATVASVDTARGLVRVKLDEFGTLTGWLPMTQAWASANTSAVCYPTPGTQVFMVPDMGDQSHMVVVGSTHYDAAPPGKVTPYGTDTQPQPITAGEFVIQHSSGTTLRLTNGRVEITGDLYVNGNQVVMRDISDKNGVHGTLDVLRQDYNQHKHLNTQPGGGVSGLTDHPTP